MAVMCAACGLEIPPGHDSTSVGSGVVKRSKKSHRLYHEEHDKANLHADINCHLLWLSNGNDCGQLVDSLIDLVRPHIENDVRVEVEDEFTQKKRDEMRELLIDELGRTCAVCSEEIDEIRQIADEEYDRPQPPQPQPTGWVSPVPIYTR